MSNTGYKGEKRKQCPVCKDKGRYYWEKAVINHIHTKARWGDKEHINWITNHPKKHEMTAKELCDWAILNITGREWRYMLIAKAYEDKTKNFTKEQIDAIKIFIGLLQKNQWYDGGGADDGVIRIKEIREVFNSVIAKNK